MGCASGAADFKRGTEMNAIKTALTGQKPALVAAFTARINHAFSQMQEKFGPTMGGIYNSNQYKFWSETVRPCCDVNKVAGDVSGFKSFYTLNESAIAKRAEVYATATVEAWEAKIIGKMQELQNAECRYLSGVSFRITGTRGDKKVSIEQDMILNVSSKGTLFNQFPARIYVEGKFTSEAKYKAM
jgi:hypothetical protein